MVTRAKEAEATSAPLVSRSHGGSGPIRRALTAAFRIPEAEVDVRRRAFHCDSDPVRERLEEVGRSFLRGYHAALEEADLPALGARLDRAAPEYRGFGHEGAGMALALLDVLAPWRRRLSAFLAGPGKPQHYIVTIGAGWILGRLPIGSSLLLRRLDPVLGWLALDGYGFHEGYFHWPRSVARQQVPRKLRGYARRGFDQGLGRSLWFVRGADPERIAETIRGFQPSRQGDLWAGVGLAASYAGGCDRTALTSLRHAAGRFVPMLAQGATFAAASRVHGGNRAAHTDLASEVICEAEASQLETVFTEASRDLPPDGTEPAFEVWRCRIQSHFSNGGAPR
jgi:enediyne biosynthesis protein E3